MDIKIIQEDIHNIYQLGFFSDIRIYKDGQHYQTKRKAFYHRH